MMPGLPVSSIPLHKKKHHEGTCLQSFQAIECFEPTFKEAQQASNMICKVMSLKSQIKTCSFLEDIITSSNEVFKEFASDMEVGIWMLDNSTSMAVINFDINKYNASS